MGFSKTHAKIQQFGIVEKIKNPPAFSGITGSHRRHPAARGRGIGLALLRDAFRRAARQGRSGTALSTDSNTGALAFYERAGMRVEESFTHWAVPLRADLPA